LDDVILSEAKDLLLAGEQQILRYAQDDRRSQFTLTAHRARKLITV
jgi:hypothetical protein